MTTAVEPERLVDPPTIPDEQLPSLDDTPACEMRNRGDQHVCGRQACVLVRGTCSKCGQPDRALLCARCLGLLQAHEHNGHPHAWCSSCVNGPVCIEQVTAL